MTKKLSFSLNVIKDYPKPGINFLDINPLLARPEQFRAVIDACCSAIQTALPDKVRARAAVITPESRGFIFAAPVAHALGLPLVLIRKKGKIPNHPYTFHITNEYTSYDMEIDEDLLQAHSHYIYMDDILATGQTLASIKEALAKKGKKILLALHITAVPALKEIRTNTPALKDLLIKEVI